VNFERTRRLFPGLPAALATRITFPHGAATRVASPLPASGRAAAPSEWRLIAAIHNRQLVLAGRNELCDGHLDCFAVSELAGVLGGEPVENRTKIDPRLHTRPGSRRERTASSPAAPPLR
jgi:hypothetical protein